MRHTILYFGNHWRPENRTSSHHVASWLAERHRVLYIECPGLRAPSASGRDLKKICEKLSRFARGSQQGHGEMTVHTLVQLPWHGSVLARRINSALLRRSVRQIVKRHGVESPIAWFTVPHVAPLLGSMGERHSVYYCIDDYASMPHVNSAAVAAMDGHLTEVADTVFVASETLLDRKRRINSNTYLSPHGVDVEHFGRAREPSLDCPRELADLHRPIIGFFGLIERWIDLELVAFLARQRPQWSFVMIGRLAVPESGIPRLPNLLFLGQRPYEDLPAYGKQFDACIVPYRLAQHIFHASPLKLREYLAMGKPVVSVSTPEIDKFADVVAIAKSPAEFLARLDDAVLHRSSPRDEARRIDRVADGSWQARLARVWQAVEQSMESRGGCETNSADKEQQFVG